MEFLMDPSIWAGLLTLVVLEIVLGIDNLVFIAILADKLPPKQRDKARLLGLSLALIDAPLAVDAQTPLSELLSHVGQAPCAVPVVDEDQQYVGIISKGMLLRALDREGVNNG